MQWKITFFVIKIIIAVITTIVLMAGTIQGAASYAKYCDQDVEDYFGYYYSYNNERDRIKFCDFSDDDRQHDPDVDFITVVVVTGIGAFSWVSIYI